MFLTHRNFWFVLENAASKRRRKPSDQSSLVVRLREVSERGRAIRSEEEKEEAGSKKIQDKKEQRYLTLRLQPSETTLLISLVSKQGTPEEVKKRCRVV
jgi:hypothetical protein